MPRTTTASAKRPRVEGGQGSPPITCAGLKPAAALALPDPILTKHAGANSGRNAYNQLRNRDSSFFRTAKADTEEGFAKLCCTGLSALGISWTREHRDRRSVPTNPEDAGAATAALTDEWDVPVADRPAQESVSLVTADQAPSFIQAVQAWPGPPSRCALVILGAHNLAIRSATIHLPLWWKPPGASEPERTFKECTIAQLGLHDVTSAAPVAATLVEGALNACAFVRMKIHESDAATQFKALFDDQFSEPTPAPDLEQWQTVPHKRQGRRKSVTAVAKDASLRTAFEEVLGKLVPSITLRSGLVRLGRYTSA